MRSLQAASLQAAAVAVLLWGASTFPSGATVFTTIPNNPTSASGNFTHAVGLGAFVDDWTFSLTGFTSFNASASATNDFPSGSKTTDPNAIQGFDISLFSNPDNIVGNGDDVRIIGPSGAVACVVNPTTCQVVGLAGTLA